MPITDLVRSPFERARATRATNRRKYCIDCKYLIIFVKYFSRSKFQEITDYLGLLQIVKADNSLYEAMKEFCKKIGLNTSKCIVLGTDGGPISKNLG